MRMLVPLLTLIACGGDAEAPVAASADTAVPVTTPSGPTGSLPTDATTADTAGPTDTVTTACVYPEGVVDPMTAGEVMPAFAWPEARHMGTGAVATLDLGQVPCAVDDDIDWSPFDVLLFVSIPAW